MILNSHAYADTVEMSPEVAKVTEFSIKATAKSFNILSSALYANKIRAIVRELSTNALDSHIAAKNSEPFDVHLPNTLEPWFAVRDYGVGLSAEQVKSIYTTYFESTKTGSNDFVGALGLGSKSPFCYTNNFTVTAIKDGVKGIYSAYINDIGFPCVALLDHTDTDEPNGVEIKFAVTDTNDFRKFISEASTVFTYFKVKPIMVGAECSIVEKKYIDMDVIPGVHITKVPEYSYYKTPSVAVMGSVAYPINIPNAEQILGSLQTLLDNAVEMHFEIGELDFQASREGLSYIPSTIAALKDKLQRLSSNMESHLLDAANAIQGKWEQAAYIIEKAKVSIWKNIAYTVAAKINNPLLDTSRPGIISYLGLAMSAHEIANKFNIKLNSFRVRSFVGKHWDITRDLFTCSPEMHFIYNDTKSSAIEKSKAYIKAKYSCASVCVISPEDKTQPVKYAEFMKYLESPPKLQQHTVSDFAPPTQLKRAPTVRTKQPSIYYTECSSRDAWTPSSIGSSLPTDDVYYYVPIKGFIPVFTKWDSTVGSLLYSLRTTNTASEVHRIYGVRADMLDAVKQMPNWIPIEDHLSATLPIKCREAAISLGLVAHPKPIAVNGIEKLHSDYIVWSQMYTHKQVDIFSRSTLVDIIKCFDLDIDVDAISSKVSAMVVKYAAKYPLINHINVYSAPVEHILHYINLVDSTSEPIA